MIELDIPAQPSIAECIRFFARLVQQTLRRIAAENASNNEPRFPMDVAVMKLLNTLLFNGFMGKYFPKLSSWDEDDWLPERASGMLEAFFKNNASYPSEREDRDAWLEGFAGELGFCEGHHIALLNNYLLRLCPKTSQKGGIVTISHGSNLR
jgi:hypothetical protein